ncbi:MAG: hypothetical protein V4671_19360 [Armatimonadota bacterium]
MTATNQTDPMTPFQRMALRNRMGYAHWTDAQLDARFPTRDAAAKELDVTDNDARRIDGDPIPMHGRKGKA